MPTLIVAKPCYHNATWRTEGQKGYIKREEAVSGEYNTSKHPQSDWFHCHNLSHLNREHLESLEEPQK